MNAEQMTARCRAWLLNAYLVDLEEYQAGDVNRFGRMVGSGSISLGSEAGWRAMVKALLVDELLAQHCAGQLAGFVERAKLAGVTR
ncbi:MAG: hypothetical protein E6Q97_21040 [Desulfurellales bacterium]|nr:MAG: hypothetical protein E6Q97_21040 [Desulfurellales bacterium]